MYYYSDKELSQLAHFIITLADGQYDQRIKVGKPNNWITTLGVLLNMLAGSMKKGIPSLSPENNLYYLNHIILLIDRDFKIQDFNTGALELFREEQLENLEFILDDPSRRIVREMIKLNAIDQSVTLNFRLKEDLYLNMTSKLTKLKNDKEQVFVLTAVKSVTRSVGSREELLNHSKNSRSQFNLTKNKQLIDDLYHYLMNNLDSPLPRIPKIAADLNTNATLLKRGFKIIHGTTIGRFHREKRLEKAKDLILDNDTSLVIIANQCGYKSESHFSRAFTKQFGVNPSKCR